MPPSNDTSSTPPAAPPVQFTNEVRYAVVMYGGVSLCIYINGVAQELLELSRVTSTDADERILHAPRGAGAVYRRIAQFLEPGEKDTSLLRGDHPEAPIRARFVVDVLSGTSAGGLNSLFLAKALTNDQDMDSLINLWMEEGDIGRLLNDDVSVANEAGLEEPRAPKSLLNSQRMYKKLLSAFDGMDYPRPQASEPHSPLAVEAGRHSPTRSPHVDELDCYITTTDLTGLPVQMKLANTVACEQRHRNVFHFRYCHREGANDFVPANNPFLAFAGRCTSAFPFAFEPMRLADIAKVLPAFARYNLPPEEQQKLEAQWTHRFCKDYLDAGCNFRDRSFGDGGYLDNKPFSYATRTLMRRRAELPVRRKLVYVDPSPEPQRIDGASREFDFIANSTAALVDLPRYETIREDVQAVLDRNKLLKTVSTLTAQVAGDVALRRKTRASAPASPRPYDERGLHERIESDGIFYATYHRLRVIDVTMNLSHLISRAAGFEVDSDECQAIRWIIDQWRDANFAEEPEPGSVPFLSAADGPPRDGATRPRSSQNSFLLSFDIDYRLRRIFYLQRRINELLRHSVTNGAPHNSADSAPANAAAYRTGLRTVKRRLAEPLRLLVRVEQTVTADPHIANLLLDALQGAAADGSADESEKRKRAKQYLRCVLAHPDKVADIYKENAQRIDAIARAVATTFAGQFTIARDAVQSLLANGATEEPQACAAIVDALKPAADQFDDYDAVIFPIQYGTDAGEANSVDIVRISPPDAEQLISEAGDAKGRRKLAGTAIFSFGAFLARFWRENDMLWGRLDTAEVLIRDLLRGKLPAGEEAVVDELVAEAHRTILSETLTRAQREELWNFISEAFAATAVERGTSPPTAQNIRAAVEDLLQQFPDLDQRLRKVLRFAGAEKDEELRTYFRDDYEVRRRLVVEDQLRIAARAGRIVARMLDVVANKRNVPVLIKPAVMLPRLAAVLWGIVEISIPRSLGWFLWRDWRPRLYGWAVVLILAGLLWQPVLVAGLVIFAVTVAIDTARHGVVDLIRGTHRVRTAIGWLSVVTIVLVLALAVTQAADAVKWAKVEGRELVTSAWTAMRERGSR